MSGIVPVAFLPGAVIALALLLAISYLHLRHAGLAILVVVAPLAGLAAAIYITHRSYPICYLPGFAAGSFLAASVASHTTSVSPRTAVLEALRSLWLVLLLALAFASLAPLLTVLTWDDAIDLLRGAVLESASGGISALIGMVCVAMVLRYDETFIVRTNRLLEARERWMRNLLFPAQLRWGASVGGIALILGVLGFFGMRDSGFVLSEATYARAASSAIVLLVAGYAVTHDIRRTLAIVFAMAPVVLVTVWMLFRWKSGADPSTLLLTLPLAAMPVLVMASGAALFQRRGDDPATATIRAIERRGVSVATIMLAAAVADTVSGGFSGAAILEGGALVFGGVAALIVQPALSTMFYTLFPKRVSLDAYRMR